MRQSILASAQQNLTGDTVNFDASTNPVLEAYKLFAAGLSNISEPQEQFKKYWQTNSEFWQLLEQPEDGNKFSPYGKMACRSSASPRRGSKAVDQRFLSRQ